MLGKAAKLRFARWKIAVERVCAELNPILWVLAAGLAVFNIGGYTGLEIDRRYASRTGVTEIAPPPLPLSTIAIVGLPQS